MNIQFSAGKNIAMKVPTHEYDATVSFYRDILGLEMIESMIGPGTGSQVFRFGDKNLWIDKVATISQAEIWLEILSDDIPAASEYLRQQGCIRRDEIESLPDGFSGFWISSPANIIHLITEDGT